MGKRKSKDGDVAMGGTADDSDDVCFTHMRIPAPRITNELHRT